MITIIGLVTILLFLLLKFKPMYKVTINGEVVGYVVSKEEIAKIISKYEKSTTENIAFIEIKNQPQFSIEMVSWNTEDDSQKVLDKIKEQSVVTYRLYAIVINDEYNDYVKTMEEAEIVVEELKEEYKDKLDFNIGVQEVFTTDKENVKPLNIEVAKTRLDLAITDNADGIIDGIILSKPITGIITSRFGERWGTQHLGLDIGANTGTEIHAASKGIVTFTGWSGGYGNLVIVDHGDGIETYYGHCSAIYTSVGEIVNSDTVIAAVGSTGNSTGPHLHFEIRKDGEALNPQDYIYNQNNE